MKRGEGVGVGTGAVTMTGAGASLGAAFTTLRTEGVFLRAGLRVRTRRPRACRGSRSAGTVPAAASDRSDSAAGALVTNPGALCFAAGSAADEPPPSGAWIANANPNASTTSSSVEPRLSRSGISPAGCSRASGSGRGAGAP